MALFVVADGEDCGGGAGLKGSNGAKSGASCFSGAGAFGATGAGFFSTGLGLLAFGGGGGGGAGFGGSTTGLGVAIVTIETSIGRGFTSVTFSSGFFNKVNNHICKSKTSNANKYNIWLDFSSPCK